MEELKQQLEEAKKLLFESKIFMGNVPNHKYGDNYAICGKIDKFLSNIEKTK